MADCGKCDPEVYAHGEAFLMVHSADGAQSVESFRTALLDNPSIKAAGCKIDWHYVAGHAVFRVIGDIRLATSIATLTLTSPAYSHWRWEFRNAS